MKLTRGQSSLELITGIGFLLFIFIIFILFAQQKSREGLELKSWIDAKQICKTFANNINMISEQGSSYYKYFVLPETIYKNFDYNLTTYSNRVEISWDSRVSPYSVPIVTSDVKIYCLDKGKNKKNKVLNDNGRILILCNRVDLKPLKETFLPSSVLAGATVNLSIDVINFGVLSSQQFTVLFNSQPIVVSSLNPEETETLKINYTAPLTPGNYTIPIIVDSNNDILESIEEDNSYNATITVTSS